MSDSGVIENKVKKSKLVTVDLTQFTPDEPVHKLDIKDFLFQELMLKEKEYREHLKNHDWTQYKGCYLATFCSTDAILAPWSFMLVSEHAKSEVIETLVGTEEEVYTRLTCRAIDEFDWSQFEGKRVLLKGCSDKSIPFAAYTHAQQKLNSYVDRVMYGEACSFVPVHT